MDPTADLRLLLASRYPLIVAESNDETRFLEIVSAAASPLQLHVWVWSATRGLARLGGEPVYGTTDMAKALEFAASYSEPAVFVLADAHPSLAEPLVLRRVKEFAQSKGNERTLVVTTARASVPPELSGLAVVWRMKPPTREELAVVVRRTLEELSLRNVPVKVGDAGIDGLVDALRGVSLGEAHRLLQQAALRDGSVCEEDVAFIREKKADLLDQAGALELVAVDDESLDAVGGLDNLKEWLRLRGRAFEPSARAFGITPPRGVLITGVPGCGKSLVAKTLAGTWKMPLVLMDVGSIYGPYVGESEQRLREALATAEAMSPVVVWIDEIEKAFAAGGGADGGVSQRVLGTFLRWMQERPDGVFVIATSNDVSALPPELLRKGRFDEVFFVDLPDHAERAQIASIQLSRRDRDPAAFDVDAIVAGSEGFSGAEIEAAVVGALYRAFARDAELTTEDVTDELAATVPLSRTRAEDVARLRAWAATRAVPAGALRKAAPANAS